MNLTFERVYPDDQVKIAAVYDIIKNSGEDMYQKHGLIHWRTPYPMESIMKNCSEREVFLIKDLVNNQYVHTFQLDLNYSSDKQTGENTAYISKFATDPQFAGSGIGKQSMDYIEKYCLRKGISKISLDVYVNSEHAIRFYKNRGFEIIDHKPTKHLAVYIMEKQL